MDTETCRREGEGRSGPAVHLGTYGCACAMCVTDAIGEMRSLVGGGGGRGRGDVEQLFSNLRKLQNHLKGLQKADCWLPPPRPHRVFNAANPA